MCSFSLTRIRSSAAKPAIRSALRVLRDGAIGGGCVPRFDGKLPPWGRTFYPLMELAARLLRQPGGTCLFCTRSAFEAVGGFSEAYYAAEDAVFGVGPETARPVCRPGRIRCHFGTKISRAFPLEFTRLVARLAIGGPAAFRDRQGLDYWYQPLKRK